MASSFKYIYGPVYSWRIGWSLGIDPISQTGKICNFNCLYCQLGETDRLENIRSKFVNTDEIISEIKCLPDDLKIDYFTISGRGEPTLASNLGEIILAVKSIKRGPVAVITNGGLIDRPDVRHDLQLADFVLLKLDAGTDESFQKVNKPSREINFKSVLDGMHEFRREYRGKLALQIMIFEENQDQVEILSELARSIKPDEVQLNTPLRPCSVKPVTKAKMEIFKNQFSELKVLSVYDAESKEYKPFSDHETALRHGKFQQ
jgi:wyosine [tRNA(Phe)-imidazoG37] synthetase (radical SAM superfamily)